MIKMKRRRRECNSWKIKTKTNYSNKKEKIETSVHTSMHIQNAVVYFFFFSFPKGKDLEESKRPIKYWASKKKRQLTCKHCNIAKQPVPSHIRRCRAEYISVVVVAAVRFGDLSSNPSVLTHHRTTLPAFFPQSHYYDWSVKSIIKYPF